VAFSHKTGGLYIVFSLGSPEEIYRLATNLRKARCAADLTQQEVADKVGTNVTYYAKLERGEAIPSLKTLEKVLKTLDLKSNEALPF